MSNYEMFMEVATKADAEKRAKDMINMSKTLGCTVEGDLKDSHAIFSGKITDVIAYIESYSDSDSIKIECTFSGTNVFSKELEDNKIFSFDAMPPFKDASTIDTLKAILSDQFRGTDSAFEAPTKAEATKASTHGSGEFDMELLAKYLQKFYEQLKTIEVTVASYDRVTKAGVNRHYYSMLAKDIQATAKTIQDGGAAKKPVLNICI